MSNEHKLVKQMDALTYNARSVLNALIRSVISASSTNGFKVKRSGIELVLTRPLIYRLYRFYQEWENNEFAIETTSSNKGFDDIVASHDQVPVTDDSNNVLISNPTSAALIIHSKILFLTSSNVSRNADTQENNSYWLDLLKNSNNSKLIANSSPIPLNIRTPIFDENLSTTRFLSHESYLFPQSYFSLDQFGYSGDDRDHSLSGKGWTIDTDEYIVLNSKKISLGSVNELSTLKTLGLRSGDYSIAWGYDTQAKGFASTAGGISSMSPSDSSISIGRYNMASGYASIAMGYSNNAVGGKTSVIGGYNNTAAGEYSGIYAGQNNVVGNEPVPFTFQVINASEDASCIIDLENCTATQISASSSIVIGKNTLIIQGDKVSEYNAGDGLILYNFTTLVSGVSNIPFYDTNGDAFESLYVIVVSSRLETQDGQTVTAIVIDRDVSYSNVDGGMLVLTYKTTSDSSTAHYPGLNSFVTGLNNIASGLEQAVVGRYNKKLSDALFIVGTGSGISSRSNSLVVKAGDVTAFGIESLSGLFADDCYALNVNTTSVLSKAGLSYTQVSNGIIYNKAGVFDGNNYNISELELNYGNGKFSCGTSLLLESRSQINIISTNITSMSSDSISISTNNGITMSASNGNLNTLFNDINLSWNQSLTLTGDTYPALPTTGINGYRDGSSSHFMGNALYAISPVGDLFNIRYTGFFTVDGVPSDVPALNTIGAESNKFWLLNTTFIDPENVNGAFEAWQMIFGRQSTYIDGAQTTGNIAIRRVNNDGNTEKDTQWRYLSYLDEVILNQNTTQQVANFKINGYGEVNEFVVQGTGFLQTYPSLKVNNGSLELVAGNAKFTTAGSGLIFNGIKGNVINGGTITVGPNVCGSIKISNVGGTNSFFIIVDCAGYNAQTSMVFITIRQSDYVNTRTRYDYALGNDPFAINQNLFLLNIYDIDGTNQDSVTVDYFIIDSITPVWPF